MRDIKNLIDKIKSAKPVKDSNQKPVVFEGNKRIASVPKEFSDELYLMCFRNDALIVTGTVGFGDYMGTTVCVGGEISYETILQNRGLSIDSVEECFLTLYDENFYSEEKFQGSYDVYSFDTGIYIGNYVPIEGKFFIPLKKLYDTCGSCNFFMLPGEDYVGLAIFSQNYYWIDIKDKAAKEDFYDTAFFSNEPDFQQNYFDGDVGNAGSYSVNNHNGRLNFSKTLFALDGNRLPMSLRMVYNPFINKGIKSIFTDNWKFNFEQYVYEKDGDYIYIDNDFRRHVFKPLLNSNGNRVSGQYYDTAHSGLLLQVNNGTVIITDGRLSELKFENKRLTKIRERVGNNTFNELTVSYTNGIISSVTDGMGRTTYFTKSGSAIKIKMPADNEITITETAGLDLTINDVDSQVYKYSYTVSNDLNVLSSVSEEARRRVKFEYDELRIKKTTVSNPKITLATYEFTYNLFANHTDIKKTELNKSIIERYSMTEEGRLIYSCELQDEKSYALSFRTQEDYDNYSAALTGKCVDCVFEGDKDSIDVSAYEKLEATAESDRYSSAKDGEDVVLVANVLVNTKTESYETIDIYVDYGIPSIMVPFTTVKVKRIKDPQIIIVPIPKNSYGFSQIFEDENYDRLFSFTSEKTLPFGLKIFNVGYYFAKMSANAECINQNTGSGNRFDDDPSGTAWYKLTNPKIKDVTGNEAVKMTSEDWLLTLDNYARNSEDYIVWCKERTEARRFTADAGFIFAGKTYSINKIKYATITDRGINTLYDSFTFNTGSDSGYITESKALVRKESTMRTETSSATCYLYFNKLYRQTKAINSFGMETVSEYDEYGNLTSSATQNGILNTKESYTYGNADGISGGGKYLIQSDSYMLGQTLSSKYRYEQNTGWMKSSTSPVGQSTDYTYESSGDLKTLSSTLNGTTSKNELTYDIDRINTAKHNDFTYDFTYGDTYEELRTVKAGNYILCSQGQISDYRTFKFYADNQQSSYDTDRYGRQKEIYFFADSNYQGRLDFRYGMPNQPGVDNAQSKLLGIDLQMFHDAHIYASATFGYEKNGNLKWLNWFDFYTIDYTYDDENRVKTQKYSPDSSSVTSEYTYWDGDALTAARIERTENKIGGNTVSDTHDEYDDLNRIYKRTKTFGTQTNTETYTYVDRTVNGNGTTYLPASLSQSVNSSFNENFAYDKNGNIVSINKSGGKVTYEYDKFNRLVRENNPILNKTYTYEYNKGGNITAKREYRYTTSTLGSPTATHSYTYGDGYKDLLTAYDGQAITYDEMAHPISYKGKQLSWMLGNLFEYGDTSFDYLYDNTRIYKSSNVADVYYHYQNGKLLGETRGSKVVKYLYDQSGITGFTLNNTVYRYIKNLQGDIVAIYKGATKVAEYAYDAWGNCTIKQDTDGIGTFNAIRYRGYYYDVETGLYYLMTRYYDPTTGRFISPDDVSYLDPETIQGLNLFAYCGNNPVMNVDPTGHSFLDNISNLADFLQVFFMVSLSVLLGLSKNLPNVAKSSKMLISSLGNFGNSISPYVSAFGYGLIAVSNVVIGIAENKPLLKIATDTIFDCTAIAVAAEIGAFIGSFVPGLGTVVGTAVGIGLGLAYSYLESSIVIQELKQAFYEGVDTVITDVVHTVENIGNFFESVSTTVGNWFVSLFN